MKIFQYIKYFIIVIIFFTNIGKIYSQEYISFFSTKYNPEEYNSSQQVWTIETGKYNTVFTGNNDGIIQFDGTNWIPIYVNNQSRVRTLKYNDNDKIFVGAVDEIGYLEYTNKGILKYVSLNNLIENKIEFGEVWKILIINDVIYFQTDRYILKYFNNKIKVIETPSNNFFFSFNVNDIFYVQINESGLYKLENDVLKFIEGSEIFANNGIFFMLPSLNQIIIGSRKIGISVMTTESLPKFHTPKFFEEINKILSDDDIYSGCTLDENQIAVGTLKSGLYIVNMTGKIVNNFKNFDENFESNVILNLKKDEYDNLWVATNKGFMYIEISSPISEFAYNSNLFGNIFSLKLFDNRMYIGTGLGAYIYENNNIIQTPEISKQTWCFEEYNTNNQVITESENIILAGSSEGLFQIEKTETSKISEINGIYTIYKNNINPSLIFYGSKSGIYILKNQKNKFIELGKIPVINNEIWKIEIDEFNNIWACSRYKGVYKIDSKEIFGEYSNTDEISINVKNYTTTDGLPVNKDIMVYNYLNKLIFLTTEGVYKFDYDKDIFFKDSILTATFPFENTYHLKIDTQNNLWLASLDDKKTWIGYKTNSNSFNNWNLTAFSKLGKSLIYDLEFSDDKNVWLATSNGIFIYDYAKDIKKDYSTPFYCLINKIIIGEDSTLFNGFLISNIDKTKINYNYNSLTFNISCTFYESHDDIYYKYQLEGYENEWSDWTQENSVSYKNLLEGKYNFKVIAKNIYDSQSILTEYTFTIKPPYYRTVYAYFIYLLIVFSLIVIFFKIYSKKISTEKTKLEKIIKERTEEIIEKNKKLEEQKEHIENQNINLLKSHSDIQLLSEIGQAITSEITIENIIDTVYFNIKKFIDISTFGIGIYNNSKKILEFFNYVENNKSIPYKKRDITDNQDNAVKTFILQKELILFKEINTENKAEDIKSEIYLPLKVENKSIGVVVLKSKNIFYKEYHLNVLKNIATNIEIALDNANAYKQLEKQKDEITEQSQKLVETLNELRTSQKIIEENNEELKKLSIIASKTDNAIMVLSKRGEIEWVNDAFTKLYGFNYDEFTKKSKSIFVSNTNKEVLPFIKEAIIEKKTVNYQVELKNSNNQSIWVQTTWTPIFDENGQVSKLIAVDSDITKLKIAENQISKHKDEIEKQNFEIKSSMEYARKIQKAILNSENTLKSSFSDYFIISRPKDIISGDFYWCRQIRNTLFIAVADCTGHGVPGALMSMLGITFLDEIINNNICEKPSEILFVLREKLKNAFKQSDKESITKDGLDLGLLSLNTETNKLQYSGAFHSLHIIRNNKMEIFKGNRMPIGFYEFDQETFTNYSFETKKGDLIYLFTDGYYDQFGGEGDKKIKPNTLKNLLLTNSGKLLIQQKNNLIKYLEDWQGKTPQTDDILILGIKI